MTDLVSRTLEYFRQLADSPQRLSVEFGETNDTIIKETWHWAQVIPRNPNAVPIRAEVREVQMVLAIGTHGCHFEWDVTSEPEAAAVLDKTRRVCSDVLAGRYVEAIWQGPLRARRLEAVVGSGDYKFAQGLPIARILGRQKVIHYEPY